MHDFRLPLWSKWELRSFGLLAIIITQMRTILSFIHVLLNYQLQTVKSATECLSCHFCLIHSTHFTYDSKGWKGAENMKVAPILSIIKLISECNTVNGTTLYSYCYLIHLKRHFYINMQITLTSWILLLYYLIHLKIHFYINMQITLTSWILLLYYNTKPSNELLTICAIFSIPGMVRI
jgi:hypothetical protein